MSDKIDFLHTDMYESFLQVETVIFDGDGQAFLMFPKQQVYMSLQYLKKEIRDEVDFLHTDKYQSFL